ncbi:MAG TPA: VOC family protein [Terracidiphilus sp.]|jgi:uncharacterized glyoxalase superfamily protein PhnB
MKNRSVPADIVLPHLVYRDPLKACAWLSVVFGFVEHYRYGDPVSGIQMHLGNAYIMLTGPRDGTESPATLGLNTQTLTVFVADVDAHYQQSRQQGAVIWEDLHETIYGERQYGVKDLDGHRWLFSRHARDTAPQDWGATVASQPH